MNSTAYWIALASVLTGCATEVKVPYPVNVPVAMPCDAAKPARPSMPTEDLAVPALDMIADETLRRSLAENAVREGYEILLVAALDKCRAPLN